MTAAREGRATGAPPDPRGIGELLRDLASDGTRLVRDEIALARSEAQEKARQVGVAVGMIAAGAVLAIPAIVLVLQAVVKLLAVYMPEWVAALLVGVVVGLVGYLLVRKGQASLSGSRLAPERTAASLRRDVDLVQGRVS